MPQSSPLEGIEWALIKYSDPKKSVAIYVMGMIYRRSYDIAINKITNLNKKNSKQEFMQLVFLLKIQQIDFQLLCVK